MITDKKSIIKIKTETDGYVRVTVECQNRINGVKFTVSEPSDKQTSVDLCVDGNLAQAIFLCCRSRTVEFGFSRVIRFFGKNFHRKRR